jgi:DNA polymerase V
MTIIALVDCNNFFVSCERSADPALEGRPVVVLSNNDGCIISRSDEAKQLGIRMGEPYFKIREQLKQKQVRVFSSNFALYSAKSVQVMELLKQFSNILEFYSIDESFLNLNHIPPRMLRDFALEMKGKIKQQSGIPVSIGIAETKTLAKLANAIAKKAKRFEGVLNLYQSPHLDLALSRTPVEKVWGVGRRNAIALRNANVLTARDLRDTKDSWILRRFNVVMMKTVLELRGTPCLPIQQSPPERKSVMYSRSFGTLIETQQHMEAAVSDFTARAAEKLREAGMAAHYLSVYMRTSKYLAPDARYSTSGELWLPAATDCTHDLIREALGITRRIFREGFQYYKVAILLTELVPASEKQMSLFETRDVNQLQTLMQTLDSINHTFGARTLQYAAEGLQKPWSSKKEILSSAGMAATTEMSKTKTQPLSKTVSPRPLLGFVHPVHG